ncbi:primosome assembly protein PriA [Nocardioides sp. Soil797]|nr:primosome assembly protein PriA [Nocardioides sp. Soil797]
MAATAVPGARVKVRFAGQDVDAFVVSRVASSDHTGRLQPLRRVVSAEPVLSPKIAALSESVARRYAGSRADVLRLAVPPRHATTEKQPSEPEPALEAGLDRASVAWSDDTHGAAFVEGLADGRSPRAVWSAAPGTDWPERLAHAAAAAHASGRGAILCVPDGKDMARVDRALTRVLGSGHHVTLSAESGPSARYRDFLAISRGARRVVVGTRAAVFAPVHDLGLLAIWDDGDDLYAEPRAPYPHTREVMLLRAEAENSAVLVAGFARTVEAEYLLTTGWAVEITPPRQAIRDHLTVSVTGATDRELERDPMARSTRFPARAFEAIRTGLASGGPVLVQTPRAGYAASLACERCRTPARCATCQGPLRITSNERPPSCSWCGTDHPGFSCTTCGHRGLRAPVRGDARTAEELGRTFTSTVVRTSSGERVLSEVGDKPAIVVATPGAEPVAEGGYAAVVLLDTWLALGRLDLRTGEEALRRWMNAAALTRRGGQVIAVGDPAEPTLQALVRWDAGGFARREMAERRSAHLPPASRMATISGAPGAVDDVVTLLAAPEATEVLGPIPVENREGTPESRVVLRAPRQHGDALSRSLGEVQRLRSARKLDPVRVQVDPPGL